MMEMVLSLEWAVVERVMVLMVIEGMMVVVKVAVG